MPDLYIKLLIYKYHFGGLGLLGNISSTGRISKLFLLVYLAISI